MKVIKFLKSLFVKNCKAENINYIDSEGEQKMKREVVLELKKQNKVNYESFDDFRNSHFFSVYRTAASMIRNILDENQKYYEETITGNDVRNQEQIYNIISFVGKRGAGKTSSMLSFAEFLRDYGRIESMISEDMSDFKLSKEKKIFTVVDSIDASILSDNEEIFEVILARMLTKFMELDKSELVQQGDYEFKRRDLYTQFEKMYKSIRLLRQRGHHIDKESDMPLQKLKDLSSTYNIKKEFLELVRDYIELISYKNLGGKEFSKKDCYIVIVIDDIDMNIKYSYEILEQIHRFLLIPNVIIMLSYESELIKRVCEIHYLTELKDLEKNPANKGKLGEIVDPLVGEYLEKMLAHGKRIYMPNLPEEMSGIIIEKKERKVKEVIFQELHERLNTVFYFDKAGRHVLEPLTLRDLSNFYNGLLNQKNITINTQDIKTEDKIEIENLKNNYRWFLGEILYRFSGNDKRETKNLEEVIESPYENKIVVAYIHLLREQDEKISVFKEEVDYYDLLAKIVEIIKGIDYTANEKRYPELLIIYFTVLFAYIEMQIKFNEKGFELSKNNEYRFEKEKWEKREADLKKSKFNREPRSNITKLIFGNIYNYNEPGIKFLFGYREHMSQLITKEWNHVNKWDDLVGKDDFVKAVNSLQYFLLFTDYYDLNTKKNLKIEKDSKNRRIVFNDEVNITFDITAWLWNIERYDLIADKCAYELSGELCQIYGCFPQRAKIKQEIKKRIECKRCRLKLLSMPDVLVNMWNRNEKMDIEVNDVARKLEEVVREWGKVITDALRCVYEKDDVLEEEFLKDSYMWRKQVFELVENSCKIRDENVPEVMSPSDELH